MKTLIILIGILFCSSVYSQIVDIPDSGFKAFLINEGIDINGDGEIQVIEAEQVLNLNILPFEPINSIVGIKAFTNLQSLYIDFSGTESIDISGMANLTRLDISATQITDLDVSNCIALQTVHMLDPELVGTADFSGCTALEIVDGTICAGTLKFNNCTSLRRLLFASCFLTELELEGCENLTYFEAFDLDFEFDFDFSEIPSLDTLILFGFSPFELEFINMPSLKYLEIDYVESLVLRDCPELQSVNVFHSTNIDIIGLPKLSHAEFDVFAASLFRIEDCSSLESLTLFGDAENMIIKNCPLIESLALSGSVIPSLWDFTGLSSLKSILTPIDGPDELILTGCYSLETIFMGGSFAKIYDFSDCINLASVSLGSCFLMENLIFKNGSKETISLSHAPNLMNVCVDPDEFINVQSLLNSILDHEVAVTTSCEFSSNGNPFIIAGTSLLDINNDSCKTSDVALQFSKYVLSDGIFGDRTFFTNEEGQYKYNLYEGQYTYGPDLLFGDYIFTTTPETRSVDFSTDGSAVNQDFCFIPNPEEVDVIEVNLIPLEPARPGFDARYLITYTNTGNVTRGGDIKLIFQDEFMDFLIAEPMESVLEEGFISWSFEDLIPYETRSIEFSMNLNSPMDTPPLNGDDILNFTAEVGPLGNQTLTVYWSHLNQEVVNSFDPNDKTCLNGNAFDQELVGDYLKYMIRFENTGTAEAVNIVVTDTLDDTKFDVRTLQVINASHEVETELTDNVIKFIFKDIYLPFEDATNDGYVTFKIKTLPSLVLGDDIRNKAEIFFDFNFPIVTNTTSTVISDFTSIDELEQNTFDLEISPNPAFESVLIRSEVKMNRIELFDVSGRLLKSISFAENRSFFNLLIDQYGTGIYFIKVYSENGNSIGKLIK